jgi:hypothetical protein
MWVFKVIPSFCLTNSVMYATSKSTLLEDRPDVSSYDFNIENMGGDLVFCAGHFFLWTTVLILIESGVLKFLECFIMCLRKTILPKENLDLDEDVIEEERRVEATP